MGLVEQIHDICKRKEGMVLTISANESALIIDMNWQDENGGRIACQNAIPWTEVMLYAGYSDELIQQKLASLTYTI